MSNILAKITSALSGDLVFLGTLFALIFIATMYFGRNRIVSLIVSFYSTTLLYKIFPFTEKLTVVEGDMGILLNKLVIFLVFYILVNVVISKYFNSYAESSSTLRKVGFSVALLILILLLSYTVVNFDALHDFSSTIDNLFEGGDRVFWWTVAPLLILVFV